MAAESYYSPFFPGFNSNGLPMAGAQLRFRLTGTTTPAPIYANVGLSTELTNPVVANSAARFPPIYLDDSITYRVDFLDADGAQLDSEDPYIPGTALRGPQGPPGEGSETQQYNQSGLVPIVYDHFDREDGPITGDACTTGETWSVSGTGAAGAQLIDGALYGDDGLANSNFYASLDYGEQITFQAGIIRFDTYGNDPATLLREGSQCVIIPQTADNGLGGVGGAMLHGQFKRTSWSMQFREEGGSFDFLPGGSGIYLMQADTDYGVGVAIDSANDRCRVYVVGPGVNVDSGWMTDARIGNWDLTSATYQIQQYVAATDAYKPCFRAVSVGPPKKGAPALLSGTLAGAFTDVEIGGLPGVIRLATFVADTNDYYRLFQHYTGGGYLLHGTLHLHATSTSGAAVTASYSVYAKNGGTPLIRQLTCEAFGAPIDKVRVSNAATECGVDISFASAVANPVTVDAWFVGGATVANYGIPKTGATALTTSTEVTVTPTPASEVTGTATVNDWYSVASNANTGLSLGAVDTFEITARRADAAIVSRILVSIYAPHNGSLGEPTVHAVHGNGAINQLRLSRLSGTGVRLDAYCVSAATSTYTITTRRIGGAAWSTLGPIAQATSALATESITVAIAQGVVNAAAFRSGGVQVLGAQQAAIADPAGGATVDAEARAAIASILAAWRAHGGIAT